MFILIIIFIILVFFGLLFLQKPPEMIHKKRDDIVQDGNQFYNKLMEFLETKFKIQQHLRNRKTKLTLNLKNIYFEDDGKPKMSIVDICNSISDIQERFDTYPIYLSSGENCLNKVAEDNSIFLIQSVITYDRVLQCTTRQGVSSLVRHIAPKYHIDNNKDILLMLKQFNQHCISITNDENFKKDMSSTCPWVEYLTDVKEITKLSRY